MKKVIIGAGGFGMEVYHSLDIIEKKRTVFFVNDEYWHENDKNILPISKFNPEEYEVVVAVANPEDRKKIVNMLPNNTIFFTHIHKSVVILGDVIEIGEGSIICAGSILTTNIKIGKHSHLNLQSTIGHDTIIGDYFTSAPGVKISGNCKIGDCVYFGTNSCVKQKIKICNNVTVGMNSGVVKNIDKSGTYVGTPSKLI